MERLVGFVDGNFLHVEGARTLGGAEADFRVVGSGVVRWLRDRGAADGAGSGFLRAYWYDGGFDAQHPGYSDQRRFFDALRHTPGLQLRLGHVVHRGERLRVPVTRALENTAATLGMAPDALLKAFAQHWEWRPRQEQKGVDVLMALDLVRLAQRRVFHTAVLMSGDRDLCEAVRSVQDEGLRVVVAHPRDGGVARELVQLADEVVELDGPALDGMLERRNP